MVRRHDASPAAIGDDRSLEIYREPGFLATILRRARLHGGAFGAISDAPQLPSS